MDVRINITLIMFSIVMWQYRELKRKMKKLLPLYSSISRRKNGNDIEANNVQTFHCRHTISCYYVLCTWHICCCPLCLCLFPTSSLPFLSHSAIAYIFTCARNTLTGKLTAIARTRHGHIVNIFANISYNTFFM